MDDEFRLMWQDMRSEGVPTRLTAGPAGSNLHWLKLVTRGKEKNKQKQSEGCVVTAAMQGLQMMDCLMWDSWQNWLTWIACWPR